MSKADKIVEWANITRISRPRVRYAHYRTKWCGAITVAVNDSGPDLLVGWSFCSPRDQFCKLRGRRMAAQRLRPFSGWEGTLPLSSRDLHALVWAVIEKLMEERRHYDMTDPMPPAREIRVPRWFDDFLVGLAVEEVERRNADPAKRAAKD